MSMPHICRCRICDQTMGIDPSTDPFVFAVQHSERVCCHKCNRNKTLTYMLTCPTCGNKRCPKASDHELACTNSNEPGQPGSVY